MQLRNKANRLLDECKGGRYSITCCWEKYNTVIELVRSIDSADLLLEDKELFVAASLGQASSLPEIMDWIPVSKVISWLFYLCRQLKMYDQQENNLMPHYYAAQLKILNAIMLEAKYRHRDSDWIAALRMQAALHLSRQKYDLAKESFKDALLIEGRKKDGLLPGKELSGIYEALSELCAAGSIEQSFMLRASRLLKNEKRRGRLLLLQRICYEVLQKNSGVSLKERQSLLNDAKAFVRIFEHSFKNRKKVKSKVVLTTDLEGRISIVLKRLYKMEQKIEQESVNTIILEEKKSSAGAVTRDYNERVMYLTKKITSLSKKIVGSSASLVDTPRLFAQEKKQSLNHSNLGIQSATWQQCKNITSFSEPKQLTQERPDKPKDTEQLNDTLSPSATNSGQLWPFKRKSEPGTLTSIRTLLLFKHELEFAPKVVGSQDKLQLLYKSK